MAFGSKDNRLITDASVINPSRFNTRVTNSPLQICPVNSGSSYPYSKIWLGHGQNNLGLVNGWLDAMKASSPPSRYVKGDPFDSTSVDPQYRTWIVSLKFLLSHVSNRFFNSQIRMFPHIMCKGRIFNVLRKCTFF